MKIPHLILVLIFEIFLFAGCKTGHSESFRELGREPAIEPDYSGVIIPGNIAPMNFSIQEQGSSFLIKATSSNGKKISIRSSNGIVRFPERSWKKLLAGSQGGEIEIEVFSEGDEKSLSKYKPFYLYVANEPIDPYISYRFLYPGYDFWYELSIVQRCIENFKEDYIVENQLLKKNCINCHSFCQNNPDKFLLHIRGSLGGTYFVEGDKITKTNLKTENMTYGAVYPTWHPEGRFVAFSSNKVSQNFHSSHDKNIEVYDQSSSLVLYDTEKNEMLDCGEEDTIQYMETFPSWSPDGNYLYYCRAKQIEELLLNYTKVKYDLVRKSFNPTSRLFGKAEVVFNALALDKSVSFPRISPDGKYLVFTLHNYGTFSIWHKEADLYLLDLQNGEAEQMSLNSNETESYHTWSSNGKWLVFSSKRGDGLTARPYFAYFNSPQHVGKPFVLPQKDPTLYKRMLKTFNIPEFVTGNVNVGPRDFARAAREETLQAKWGGNTQ